MTKEKVQRDGAKGKAGAGRRVERGDLAALISRVFRHPDTPASLAAAIGDWLLGVRDEDVELSDPDLIRELLAKAKGGRG